MDTLIEQLSALAATEGDHATAVPGLTIHRRNAPTEPLHCIYTLSVAYIAQGEKRVFLDDIRTEIGAGQTMLTALDLPVVSHVTRATAREPFLALLYVLDTTEILNYAAKLGIEQIPRNVSYPAISVAVADGPLCDVFERLIRLTNEPDLVPLLAPGIGTEIIVRLLTGPNGGHLLNRVSAGSPNERIGKAVTWLKRNFTESLDIDALAARVHMSPSTFRRHFKTITGNSPLQYQKQMRLQEARHLMLSERQTATTAGREVGYTSMAQFSREYRRTFGAPPKQDVERLLQTG